MKDLDQDKPEITKYKHQNTNKFQITISKSQIRSKTNCLEFWISFIVICLLFVFCCLKFLIVETFIFRQDILKYNPLQSNLRFF